MTPYAISLPLIGLVWVTIVYLNERHNLLSCDHFRSAAAKWFAYIWLGIFMLGLTFLVTASALRPAEARDLTNMPFYSLFGLHAVLIVFLIGWWLASGRPPLREFLNIRHERPLEVVSVGVAVGVGGWMFTLLVAMIIALLLQATGMLQQPDGMPPMIGWMAALPLWKKAVIVLSAMTIEEFFFRSFLQKRIGLIASTLLFGLAHFTYGQPLLLVGVTVISIIIGLTFYRTRNVLPGVIAHGVFDAIQLFVIVPFAVKMMGG
ncbi:MAG: protease family protein [Acidobacteriota bacterium]|jgi:membrane protease YdiL (CAAX protease family)|nr:protease family protein [Acidobacteriota bacterium]